MVVTDSRVVFQTTDTDGNEDAGVLSYDELAGIDADGPLTLSTTDGIVWTFPVTDGSDIDGARRHLSWVGDLRRRVISTRNDVELATGEMESLAADLSWEDAAETYREARATLDDLIATVLVAEPFDEDALAPELTEIERTLETAHVRLHIERAESQLELGSQLVDNEDYDQARKVLEQAQEYYEQARQCKEPIKRADAFQFGTQRELETELEDLGWEIETVAAEPIRQAHEAKIRAQEATTIENAIAHWETALRRYGNVRTLEWGDDDRNFAGDPETVHRELQTATERLIDLHERRARQLWNEGSKREANDDLEPAIARCRAATEHLERAHELADELDTGRAEAFATRLKKMFEALLVMREALEDETTPEDEDSGSGKVDPANGDSRDPERADSDSTWPPSVEELSEIDTHHDITLSVDGVSEPLERDTIETAPDRDEDESRDGDEDQHHRASKN